MLKCFVKIMNKWGVAGIVLALSILIFCLVYASRKKEDYLPSQQEIDYRKAVCDVSYQQCIVCQNDPHRLDRQNTNIHDKCSSLLIGCYNSIFLNTSRRYKPYKGNYVSVTDRSVPGVGVPRRR